MCHEIFWGGRWIVLILSPWANSWVLDWGRHDWWTVDPAVSAPGDHGENEAVCCTLGHLVKAFVPSINNVACCLLLFQAPEMTSRSRSPLRQSPPPNNSDPKVARKSVPSIFLLQAVKCDCFIYISGKTFHWRSQRWIWAFWSLWEDGWSLRPQ